MPGAARRMYPARTSSLWEATSASAGSSRRVRRNSVDMRSMGQAYWPTLEGSADVPPVVIEVAGSRTTSHGSGGLEQRSRRGTHDVLAPSPNYRLIGRRGALR